MIPVSPVPVTVTIVQAHDTAVEPAAMKGAGVKAAPVEPGISTVEPAAVETSTSAAVETPTSAAVETPTSAAVETPTSAPAVRRVGEAWLAEDSRAQQCSCNAHHTPPFPGPGSAVI